MICRGWLVEMRMFETYSALWSEFGGAYVGCDRTLTALFKFCREDGIEGPIGFGYEVCC